MWEKEKSLITSNFSFSHNVFKRLLLHTFKNKVLFRKGITFYHTNQRVVATLMQFLGVNPLPDNKV